MFASPKAVEFTSLLSHRYSVRDFRPEPVPDETLSAILDDARHAPSWSNTRPYALAVATGERLERLRTSYVQEFNAALGLQRRRKRDILKAVLTGKLPDADYPTWKRYPDDLRARSVKVGKGLYQHIGIARETPQPGTPRAAATASYSVLRLGCGCSSTASCCRSRRKMLVSCCRP